MENIRNEEFRIWAIEFNEGKVLVPFNEAVVVFDRDIFEKRIAYLGLSINDVNLKDKIRLQKIILLLVKWSIV